MESVTPSFGPLASSATAPSILDRHPVIESLRRQGVLIDHMILSQLTDQQISKPKEMIEFLKERRAIQVEKLYRAYGDAIDLPFFNLDWTALDVGLMSILPRKQWLECRCIPVKKIETVIEVAMAEPQDAAITLAIQEKTGCRVQRLVAVPAQVDQYLMVNSVDAAMLPRSIAELEKLSDSREFESFANSLVLLARQQRSSDIHIEALEQQYRIRFRIDGQLIEQVTCPEQVGNGLVNYFKVASDLDIAERRIPQDGRMSMAVGEGSIELRTSTVPTVDGEKMVLRLLDQRAVSLDLEKLNFSPNILQSYRKTLAEPHGIIIATGPTGSGKTTTLYASLMELAGPQVNITTIEDPVEYRIGGINQIQVHKKINLDFNRILRSCLRQDPDVILVGEMRDGETAETAVRAALTGHLVLSTLHTNDAPGAIARMVNMGVPAYLLAQGLRAVVGQRLVRRICDHCRMPVTVSATELNQAYGLQVGSQTQEVTAFVGQGCEHCNHSGYRGRLPVQELLVISDDIRTAISDGAPVQQWLPLAHAHGYRSVIHDTLVKALAGYTTINEVLQLSQGGE